MRSTCLCFCKTKRKFFSELWLNCHSCTHPLDEQKLTGLPHHFIIHYFFIVLSLNLFSSSAIKWLSSRVWSWNSDKVQICWQYLKYVLMWDREIPTLGSEYLSETQQASYVWQNVLTIWPSYQYMWKVLVNFWNFDFPIFVFGQLNYYVRR